MKKKIAVFGVATLAFALGVCFSARAASSKSNLEGSETMKAQRAEIREDMQAQKDEVKENRKEIQQQKKERNCEKIQNRVRTRINRYENKQEQHRNVFGKLAIKGEEISAKFKEKGLDTSALDDALVTLKEKIKNLEIEHQTFIDELEATETVTCGELENQFKEKLGEARKMSTQVRAEIVEIREYYQTVLRGEILKLRDQLEAENEVELEE